MLHLYSIGFPNGKRYFGIAVDPKQRWTVHCSMARKGSTKQRVHSAIRKHGQENCTFDVLVIGEDDYVRELERKAIAVFETRNPEIGYNLALGGEMSPVAGIGHTEASRAKMSISQKNRERGPETWMKFATSRAGVPVTEEHRKKLSEKASARWNNMEERRLPITLKRLEIVRELLAKGFSRKEIQKELGLSKARTRLLILEIEPIITEE